MANHRFAVLTLPLAAASLALGACGGGDPDATAGPGDQRAEAREAMLDFAKCMREHGVNMPDPQPGERGGIKIAGPDFGADKATMNRAEEACRKILERVRPPELSAEQEQEFKDRALEFARCMREQGIDMPDPTFGQGGRITQRIEGGPGKGLGPDNPRFRAAMEECEEYQPKFGRNDEGE
jgi:hypothetical protein